MLAKQAQVLDHMTGGRLVIGLGAGGAPSDQAMWGVGDWSPSERTSRFAEYVEVVDGMTRNEEFTHRGTWYRTQGAVMAPGFVQSPRPPLLLAAHGDRTLRVAARYADTWNTIGPTLEDAQRMSAMLDEACLDIGRDPASIARSVLFGVRPATAWTSASEFADLVKRWHASGFTDFVFYDPPYRTSGLPAAEAVVTDELLDYTIPSLRADLATS